jgi:hypothetical protein
MKYITEKNFIITVYPPKDEARSIENAIYQP